VDIHLYLFFICFSWLLIQLICVVKCSILCFTISLSESCYLNIVNKIIIVFVKNP
jgi:hypothetical protein